MTELSNSEIGVYLVGALYATKEFLVPLVKGSFARNLQAKDEADKAVQKKLEEHEHRLNELDKVQGRTEVKMDASSSNIAVELSGIKSRLDALDTRIEKSGKSHDERLEKGLADVALELNRKLTSTLNSELERTVRDVLREELKARAERT